MEEPSPRTSGHLTRTKNPDGHREPPNFGVLFIPASSAVSTVKVPLTARKYREQVTYEVVLAAYGP
jgi:hypothetical protein